MQTRRAVLDIGEPSPKQKEFLLAREKYVAFGGARGGGKSWAVRAKAKLLALRYPGIKILIVRRTYPELVNNHINILRSELYGIAKYNDKDKVLKFMNGSSINFTYCAKDQDLDRLQGQEYDVIFLDEATQLSEWQMRSITACLRGANNFPKRMYFTANPGGQGHQYIKRLFVDRHFEATEKPEDYKFIQSLVTDNAALLEKDPEYVHQLEALPQKLRDAWLYGSWDVYEGQFFEEFRDDPSHYKDRMWTHVIEPFEIDPSWTIYRSFDWGYAKPFSFGWWAIDPDNVAYRILEYYGCTKTPNEGLKMTPNEVFAEVHRIETEHRWLKGKHIHGVADPAIWNAQTGESIAETASKYGIYFQKGDNERLAGWMQVHYRLAFDRNGFPMMYFFNTCKAIIRTMPLMVYDEHRVEDLDTEGEDHGCDDVRYFSMARPISPRVAEKAPDYTASPMYQYLDIKPGDLPPTSPRKPRMVINYAETEKDR